MTFNVPCRQISEKLRFFDPQLKEKPEQELFNEPEWLIHLRQLDGQIRVRRGGGNVFTVMYAKVKTKHIPNNGICCSCAIQSIDVFNVIFGLYS